MQKKLVFSGDIGNTAQPLLRDPIPTKDADYVIMESTYGDSSRVSKKTRDFDLRHLKCTIDTTLNRGGGVPLPSPISIHKPA